MSTTPNYGWPLLATNQASPEVTHNAAITDIDQAFGSLLVKALPDSNYTLNLAAVPSEASYLTYMFTGSLTADRNVIAPTNKKLYSVWNNATSPYNIVFKTAGGSGITIPYSATAAYVLLYCDGTNIVSIGTQSGGGGGGGGGGGSSALVWLETQTASSSATLDFSTLSSAYVEYLIEVRNLVPDTNGAALLVQGYTGSAFDTTSGNYMGGSVFVQMDGGGNGNNSGKISFSGAYLSDAYEAAQPGISASIKLFNDASGVNWRQLLFQTNGPGNGGGYFTQAGGAIWKSTVQTVRLRFLLSSGNMASGSILLYGVTP